MNAAPPRRRGRSHLPDGTPLVLGVVVVPHHGRLADALQELRADGLVELGDPQDHRIPASLCTAAGDDEAALTRLESLRSVAAVEVVFAQLLEEEGAT